MKLLYLTHIYEDKLYFCKHEKQQNNNNDVTIKYEKLYPIWMYIYLEYTFLIIRHK